MDSWNGKPIHQVNYTLITSSPTDLGVRHEEGLHFVLGMNSKRHYVKPSYPWQWVCELLYNETRSVGGCFKPAICVFYKERFLRWLHLITALRNFPSENINLHQKTMYSIVIYKKKKKSLIVLSIQAGVGSTPYSNAKSSEHSSRDWM